MQNFRDTLSAIAKRHYSVNSRSPYESKRSRFLRRAARLNDQQLDQFEILTEGLNLETHNVYALRTLIRVAEERAFTPDVHRLKHLIAEPHVSAADLHDIYNSSHATLTETIVTINLFEAMTIRALTHAGNMMRRPPLAARIQP